MFQKKAVFARLFIEQLVFFISSVSRRNFTGGKVEFIVLVIKDNTVDIAPHKNLLIAENSFEVSNIFWLMFSGKIIDRTTP